MLALPMWLLYELGIILARFIVGPVAADAPDVAAVAPYQPPDSAAMEQALDKAADESQQNRSG
jgi:Sec-independent protein secretion pathway component TatC